MAAYAALVSLLHTINHIQSHPYPPVSLDSIQLNSLTEKVTFLQEFLEGYSHVGREAEEIEALIADAAYAAEDVIESHIVEHVLDEKNISPDCFYEDLQKVIADMDRVNAEVMEIRVKMAVQDHYRSSATSSGSVFTRHNTIVGFEDVLYEMMDRLTGWEPDCQIIAITGMGGIGKTTLARNIYENKISVQHFDVLAWATISQEKNMRDILLQLLKEGGDSLSQMNEYELGDRLHKHLSSRRYLIIIDDVWNIEAWDLLRLFFPENNNGSRIILTTRLSNLGFEVANYVIEMGFLDETNSWNLFCKYVFGDEDCPLQLEEIGKKIVANCKGLPLSIIVIGGVLAKSEKTQLYWENIAENLSSIVNLEDNERCLQILYTSYNCLPVHLKPCFLYMGVFPEDTDIHVSELIKLWVAEGFLKPIHFKSLEEVALEYLEELISRNLILVGETNYLGKIKFCKIHDLLRDLCLREACRQRFICVLRDQSQDVDNERRICIHQRRSEKGHPPQLLHALESKTLLRSLIWKYQQPLPPFALRLLRVSSTVDKDFYGEEEKCDEFYLTNFQQVNLRYLAFGENISGFLPPSISLLWNLQTLVVVGNSGLIMAPLEIWNMSQLRHVQVEGFCLPDPPVGGRDNIVLENLQTLTYIYDFNCCQEVVKKLPNIRKLKVSYALFTEESPVYSLNNLGNLDKLESFRCSFEPEYMPNHFVRHLVGYVVQNISFPHSLKKLTLDGIHLHWENLSISIGSLPLLRVLKLYMVTSEGPHWETIEGNFCSLKLLLIDYCDLEYWGTDSTHFPHLEHLVLGNLPLLQEIPSTIGDIPTLQSIQLRFCTDSAVESAKRIIEEQQDVGNVQLQLQLRPTGRALNLPHISKIQRVLKF